METNPCDPSLQSGILEKLYRQVIGYISAFIGIKWRAKRQIEDVTLITNFSNEVCEQFNVKFFHDIFFHVKSLKDILEKYLCFSLELFWNKINSRLRACWLQTRAYRETARR